MSTGALRNVLWPQASAVRHCLWQILAGELHALRAVPGRLQLDCGQTGSSGWSGLAVLSWHCAGARLCLHPMRRLHSRSLLRLQHRSRSGCAQRAGAAAPLCCFLSQDMQCPECAAVFVMAVPRSGRCHRLQWMQRWDFERREHRGFEQRSDAVSAMQLPVNPQPRCTPRCLHRWERLSTLPW